VARKLVIWVKKGVFKKFFTLKQLEFISSPSNAENGQKLGKVCKLLHNAQRRLALLFKKLIYLIQTKNQTFHYTRPITPKRVTSVRCPLPCHITEEATQLPA